MQVSEVNGDDVVCLIKNSATLSGSLYTLHVSQIHIDLPTLTDKDKEVSSLFAPDTMSTQNQPWKVLINFLSLINVCKGMAVFLS